MLSTCSLSLARNFVPRTKHLSKQDVPNARYVRLPNFICRTLFRSASRSSHEYDLRLTCSAGWTIDCFKCVSIDGNNKPCDDPFHNNGSLAFLESPCLGGRKGRDGLFPATACLKVAGIYGKLNYRDTIAIIYTNLYYNLIIFFHIFLGENFS